MKTSRYLPAVPMSCWAIKFEDNNYRLTANWLKTQVDADTVNKANWRSSTLKFISSLIPAGTEKHFPVSPENEK